MFGYVTAPKATRLAALTMTMVAGSDVLQFVYDAIQNGASCRRRRTTRSGALTPADAASSLPGGRRALADLPRAPRAPILRS